MPLRASGLRLRPTGDWDDAADGVLRAGGAPAVGGGGAHDGAAVGGGQQVPDDARRRPREHARQGTEVRRSRHADAEDAEVQGRITYLSFYVLLA